MKKNQFSKREIEEQLIENFVKMQKVMTNLALKFETLSQQISGLLELFEIAAKSFVEKHNSGKEDEKDMLVKLDTLLDQNKTIAKGLTLMEEKIRNKIEFPENQTPRIPHVHNESELHGFYPSSKKPFPDMGSFI